MTWWAVEVRAAPDDRAGVAEWLVRHTGQAVAEQDDGLLVGYAPDEAAGQALGSALSAAGHSATLEAVRPVQDVDWSVAWRAGLAPRTIGRLTIVPSWCEVPAGAGPIVRLDPGTAFGTGEHGSTRGALALLDRHLAPDALVLDLGSGSGLLALAAVRLGARRAVGIENDAEAVPVAIENAERNGLDDRVAFLEGDAGDLAPLVGPAGLVVSNILRDANTSLLPAIRAALTADGIAVFSGMEAPEAPLFRTALDQAGFEVVEEVVDAGWWSVAARPR